jgi:16S rRNA (guanine527-N7)-methyltransferase
MNLSNLEIEQALRPYGVAPIPGLAAKIRSYVELLLKWNSKISLTTVEEPSEIIKFHFGESLFALSQLQIEKSRLADVGSGAGFPGLPLAMAIPAVDVTLIESNVRKCAFLAEVIRRLQIPNATVYQGRMESVPVDCAPISFVTARALGQFNGLLTWSRIHLTARGKVLLWLGESDASEISGYSGWDWSLPLPVPGSAHRVILSGSPKL